MKKTLKVIMKYLIITFGTSLYALGTTFFFDPHGLAPGGVSGVSIIITKALIKLFDLDLPIALFVLLINIPLLIVGLKKFGKDFLFGTVFSTLVLTLVIFLLEELREYLVATGATWFIIQDTLVSGAAGGVLMALGLSMVLKVGATTGGTDIVVKLLRLKYRHMKTGKMLLITDATIAVSSIFVDGSIETVMYSLIAMLTCSLVLDFLLYGPDGAKLVYIVSDKSEQIAGRLINEVDVGATFLNGVGAYTMKRKEVLMCVIKKHLYPKVRDVALQEDPQAFLIVSSANEVYGLGYKDYTKEQQ